MPTTWATSSATSTAAAAQVTEQGQKGTLAFVQGFVPLAEMFGYINFLRSATSGRGTFTMEFDHYAEVSPGLVDKLMERETK